MEAFYIGKRKKKQGGKKKPGRKSKWSNEATDDLIDIIVNKINLSKHKKSTKQQVMRTFSRSLRRWVLIGMKKSPFLLHNFAQNLRSAFRNVKKLH
jgi:hypothetical protein